MPVPASPFDPPPPDRTVVLESEDGTRLYAEVRGEDDLPTVVLVHGWTNTADFWTRLYSVLDGRFRIVSYDQRGHGRSGAPGSLGFTPDALPADLACVVEHLVPASEKAVVAGHSMGAMTIVEAAGVRPELIERRVAGVVLASTGVDELLVRNKLVPMPLPVARAARMISGQVLSARVRLTRHPDPVSRAAIRYVTMSRTATEDQVEFASRQILGCDAQVRGQIGRVLATLDLSPHLEHLTVPTVVIGGDADKLTPIWHARRLAERLPNVEAYIELPGVGHMSPLQAPHAIAGAIERLADVYLLETVR